jgi:dihydrofolate reductase
MRKVIAEIAVSVDGFIEGPEGELDWLVFDEENGYVNEFLSRFEVIFYGRLAYERFGVHLQAEENMADDFRITVNNMRKYVFSRSVKHVPGNGMMVNGNIRETVRRITEEEGKDIWLCGGAEIINTFANMGLIDEYMLAVQPTILGSGKPLFSHVDHRIRLELLHAERLNSGVVLLNYKPLCERA